MREMTIEEVALLDWPTRLENRLSHSDLPKMLEAAALRMGIHRPQYWLLGGPVKFNPELLVFSLNVLCFFIYAIRGDEPGKILYWLGASVLMLGLLLMKG